MEMDITEGNKGGRGKEGEKRKKEEGDNLSL